jgi:hypothetical protein
MRLERQITLAEMVNCTDSDALPAYLQSQFENFVRRDRKARTYTHA